VQSAEIAESNSFFGQVPGYTWSQPLAQSSSGITVPESQDEAGD